MSHLVRLGAGVALLLVAALPLRADPPALAAEASPYGDTYTAAELAALDRALHAGNMTREDLTFRKDMAKGIGCYPIVKELLRDPLAIAPFMDRQAHALLRPTPGHSAPNALVQALAMMRTGGIDDSSAVEAADRALGNWDFDDEAAQMQFKDVARQDLLSAVRRELDLNLDWVRRAARPGPEAGLPREAGTELAPEDLCVLRRRLPAEMAMHEVVIAPLDPVEAKRIETTCAAHEPIYVQDLAQRLDDRNGPHAAARLFRLLGAVLQWPASALEVFPTDRPWVEETPFGRIAFGTPGDDVYTGDYYVIIDPDGNDRYVDGRFAAATGEPNHTVGLVIDLNGDDVYDCGEVDVTLGAAVLGAAALFDLGQGDDRYVGGHVSLGAGIGGVGILYDDGGSDVYEGKAFTQGAAGYGIGILFDDAVQPEPDVSTSEETKDPIDLGLFDNDRLHAWVGAQAFARCRGVALCVNRRGNEVYEAGGVYLDAPLFADRYQSFSQGFAIGAREHDMAGGIALLVDGAGNDRYLGDIYNQGVGYWYSAGLLWDGAGNDLYEMTQYGQGSGIHLAVGGLVDVAGSDAYLMHSGLGQGGGHDYACSVLHDRGGNDRYDGNTSCNGTGLTNSVGLFFERAGDDTYMARRDGSLNAGRPARGYGSVGVFVDLAGKDDYPVPDAKPWEVRLGLRLPVGPTDDALWRGSDLGVGIDLAPAPDAPEGAGGATSIPNQLTGKAEIPAVCRYEGALTQAAFDELWAISVRWEVGDNRAIVPEARKRLIAFGKDILPMLDAKLEKDESGLELRAFVDILGGLQKGGAEEGVLDLLRRNVAPGTNDRRKRVSLHLVGELKVKDLEGDVVHLLQGGDEALARRAAGVLALLGSQAGNATLLDWIKPGSDERLALSGLGVLLGTGSDVYPQVRPLLDHPLVTVRTRLATLLAEKRALYGAKVLADLAATDLSVRAQRTLLDVIVRGPIPGSTEAWKALEPFVQHADWAVRADAARVIGAWVEADTAGKEPRMPAEVLPLSLIYLQRLSGDADPFVRRAAEAVGRRPAATAR